jgi:anti-sigma-K factor RskA
MSPAPERIEELAALCAAGAASASERAELESLAAADAGVRDLMSEFADAASLMALDLPPLRPPPDALESIRRRVATAAAGAGGAGLPGVSPVPGAAKPGAGGDVVPLASRRRAPVVVAVALPLAAAAAFAFLWLRERDEGSILTDRLAAVTIERDNERRVRTRTEQQAARLTRERDELAGTLQKVSTPELRLATVKDAANPTGVVLKILIDPLTGNWYVMAFQVPRAEEGKDYQLWLVDKSKPNQPIPSELFRTGPSGALQVITQVPQGLDPVGAAISLEPRGGSPNGKPTQVLGGGAFL